MGSLVPIDHAVGEVPRGTMLALGGMTLYRRPLALVRELLRRGSAEHTLLALTCGLESDLLLGAGAVSRVRTCYFGLEGFGLAPMFTALSSGALAGSIEIIEETEVTIAAGLRAALSGLTFLPARGILGSDVPRVRPDLKTVTCPYTRETYIAIPPLRPQVAFIHAQRADAEGNASLVGNLGIDREIAALADLTIVSAEEIVPTGELPEGRIDLWAGDVDFVVRAPRGAAPTSCYPNYRLDGLAVLDYTTACRENRFVDWLEAFLGPR
ncbi:MAG: CoA transferase subunit A [Planctomycetes bacterium]|nr:CoA transferase subunit A [Planctomycetota bacterium]